MPVCSWKQIIFMNIIDRKNSGITLILVLSNHPHFDLRVIYPVICHKQNLKFMGYHYAILRQDFKG